MFCPYCGTESTQGLNYCNRCGGNLAPLVQTAARESRPAVVTTGAAWAAGLTTACVAMMGVVIIFPITTELASRGMSPKAIVGITFLVALADLGCVGLLLRFWSQLFGLSPGRPAGAGAPALEPPKATDTRELGTARFDSLNPAPISSVAEQTTRTLDRVKK